MHLGAEVDLSASGRITFPSETRAYISDLATELSYLAEGIGEKELAHLLREAAEEAIRETKTSELDRTKEVQRRQVDERPSLAGGKTFK